jgi:hypothetical protein
MSFVNHNSHSQKFIFSFSLLFFSFLISFAIAESNLYMILGIIGVGIILYFFKSPQKMVYLLIFSLMSLDWLSGKWDLIPRQLTWIPEILSIITILYIIMFAAKNKMFPLQLPYILIYLFILLTFLGIFLNNIAISVAFSGLRNHLKFLPFFLLPFFYTFSDNFIKKFIILVLLLSFLQGPVSMIQRLVFTSQSGDVVGGTLGASASGILSLFCSMVMILWIIIYFRLHIRFIYFTFGLIVLFVPMTLNETKISIFLIPVVFISALLIIPEAKSKARQLIILLLILIIFFSLFKMTYNYYYGKDSEHMIETYISNPKKVLDYIYFRKYNKSGELNRIPQIIFAYQHVSGKLLHFIFGVGAGNASDSFFSEAKGIYHKRYDTLGIDSIFISNMIWEYGIFGTILYLFICTFLFLKTYSMRKKEGILGVTAMYFLGMSIILLLSTIYLNTMRVNLFLYLYWFVGGYLIDQYYYKSHDQIEKV